jgi:hypothetical protein
MQHRQTMRQLAYRGGSSKRGRMKRHAILFAAATLISSAASADTLKISCPLVRQYNETQVNFLLSQARSAIGEQEVGKIYTKYVGLKSECLVNNNAFRTVPVTAALRNWLNQNGVNISAAGKL